MSRKSYAVKMITLLVGHWKSSISENIERSRKLWKGFQGWDLCQPEPPSASVAMLQHTIPTWRDPLFNARGRSFNNPEQLDSDCPAGGTESFRKKGQPSDTRSLINPEILIGPRGCSISLLCLPVSGPISAFLVAAETKCVCHIITHLLIIFLILN